ncbi:MAG: SDR family NAD(P)-dependent oxidoreductase [Chromatiales bacterium]|jgi:3-oxoacyl-[acyl-carrier protein] reductase|nr:SDR family NAD(P)-dependent oxidoreductase [Chromatiales bacterium]
MDLQLTDKVAVVTGASRGIGEAIAATLIAEGAMVVLAARRADVLEATAQRLGERAVPVQADVTSLADLDRLAEVVRSRFGRCDILVNNAGTGTYKPFLEVTEDDLLDGMAINFFAQFRLTQRIVPMMMEAGGGVVVNISGRTATRTAYPPGSTCTGPAKAAEVRFTADLAEELKPHNIRVVGVIPGVVMTPERFAKWEREAKGRDLTEQEAESLRERLESDKLPDGANWGRPQEIADFVAFFASERASYLSGESLIVAGSPNAYSYVRALNEPAAGN